jgi:hypothetical protein
MSPVTVVLLALVVFGLGYGLVFGLRQLQRSAQINPTVLAAARTPAAEAATPEAAPTATAHTIPPPPDVRHLEAATETPPTGPPVSDGVEVPPPPAEAMAAQPGGAAYTPPEQGGAPPATARGTAAGGWQAGSGGQAPEFYPAAQRPLSSQQGGAFSEVNPAASSGEMHSPPPSGLSAANLPLQTTLAAPLIENAAPMTGAPIPAVGPEEHAAESVTAAVPTQTLTTDAQAAAGHLYRRSPIPRYTRLVRRLQTAVVNGDEQAADRLAEEFATAKGKGHPYLAKIKAYRRIQAGDYGMAETLLKRVLALDETDRDAQMNLAVVEANTGRVDAARRRVARLAARFPEDETVAALGRRLN